MGWLRNGARANIALAALLLLAAMAVRLAVPAGFMPMRGASGVTLTLCSGHGPMMLGHHRSDDSDHSDQPCGFGALSLTATGGADPIQLSAAIAFVEAQIVIAPAIFRITLPPRWRPPLRAPPA
jgi:hypothetical protein